MNLYLCDQNGLHMYQYKYVFAQLMAFIDRNHFNYLVRKYGGDKYVKTLQLLESAACPDVWSTKQS